MNLKKPTILLLLSLLISCFSFAQTIEEKPLQLLPYIGLNTPLGDFKDYSDGGITFGLSLDKYLSNNFALGIDLSFQSNAFKNPFDFSSISAPYSLRENNNGSWNATSFTFGPTYKIGNGSFYTEIFAKAGLLYLKSPEYKAEIVSPDFSKTIFELPSQERTGFAFITGFRFNYKISKSMNLFLNPQYVYSSAKIDYCNCGVEAAFSDGTFNPDVLIENESIKKSVQPSYLNINAGIKWNIHTKATVQNENQETVRNLPGCMERLQTQVECTPGGPQVYVTSEWWGQNSNNILSVSVYDGNTLVFSGPSISNNNMALGAPLATRTHHFVANGFEGRSLRVEISIDDQFGALSCYENNLIISIPDCEYSATCGWDVIVDCDSSANANKITVPSIWANVPAGSMLNFTVLDPVGNPINYTSNPNNLPQSISGNGSATHELFVSGYSGIPLVFKMEILDSNGNVICSQATDLLMPECNFKTCEPKIISAKCENGNVTIDFEVPWTNFNQFANLFVFADLYDSNGNLIQSLSRPLTGINGTASFNTISLPQQYAGTTINIQTRICKIGEPVQKCDCLKKLTVEIPKCCEICDGISIVDNTNVNQKGEGWLFKILWHIAPITTGSVDKIIITLESFGANNSTPNPVLPAPNFEIEGAGILTPSIPYSANPIGSLNSNRSNIWVIDFPSNAFTGGDLATVIGRYDSKVLKHYRLKITLFKTDGTYCEQYLPYSR